MTKHNFLFEEGIWYGEGVIKILSLAKEQPFFTKWSVVRQDLSTLYALQEVELREGHEKNKNHFYIRNMTQDHFDISLNNELFGYIEGKGYLYADHLSWEFHSDKMQLFEGFELYKKIEDELYMMRAEYAIAGEPHTLIQGKLWKKAN